MSDSINIVYLDQNAASYLAVCDGDQYWTDLRCLLRSGFERRRVVCPMPLETLVESSPCSTEQRVAIDQFFKEVGGGITFKSFHEILAEETLHLIRPGFQVDPCEILIADWGQHDERASNVRATHGEIRTRMTARMAAFTVTPEVKQLSPKQLFKEAGRERCAWTLRDLQRFMENPKRSVNDYEDAHLMGFLIRHGLTVAEATELREHVRYHRWEAIPVNAYDLLIGSVWSADLNHDRRKYRPNDEIDRWRAVVALRYAQLLVTDGPMAELCRRARVLEYSDTLVVSVKERQRLRDVVSGFM